MNRNKQGGYMRGIGSAVTFVIWAVAIAAMPVGWAMIEGLIWLYNHVQIGIVP